MAVAFNRACDSVQTTERIRLRLADRSILLEFAGTELMQQLASAFAHVRDDAHGSPDFTIRLFDSRTTPSVPPPPPWGSHDYLGRGEIRGFNTERFRTAYLVDVACLSMADLQRRAAVFWIRDPRRLPKWMEAAPLRTMLAWWAQSEGLQLVHGAGLAFEDVGFLLTAAGGAGKSTTAIRCALAGFDIAGDDYVILDPAKSVLYSLYRTAKADDAALDRFFPRLRPQSHGRIDDDGSGKHVFFLDEIVPNRLSLRLSLAALVVPTLMGEGSSRVDRLSRAKTLRALAPTTLFQLAGTGRQDLRTMADLVARLPCSQLSIGTDDDVADVLRGLLDAAPERAS